MQCFVEIGCGIFWDLLEYLEDGLCVIGCIWQRVYQASMPDSHGVDDLQASIEEVVFNFGVLWIGKRLADFCFESGESEGDCFCEVCGRMAVALESTAWHGVLYAL